MSIRYFTQQEVSEQLQINLQTLRNHLYTKRLPSVLKDGKRLIPDTAIYQVITNGGWKKWLKSTKQYERGTKVSVRGTGR